jgi:hypothetical protein
MSNEFVARNGVISLDSVIISGGTFVRNVPSGSSSNQVVVWNSTTNQLERKTDSSSSSTGSIGATFDGGGSVVLINTVIYQRIPKAGTITAWSIVAEGTNPTCTIDVWKVASGTTLPTSGNTITASSKPALSTGNAVKSTTMTSWTTSIAADDIMAFTVTACSAATEINFVLYITWS